MNILDLKRHECFLNEYSGFSFELSIEINHFSAKFHEKMNIKNISATASQV